MALLLGPPLLAQDGAPQVARAATPAVSPALLRPPDSLTDVSTYRAALEAACPHPSSRDRRVLLSEEAIAEERARRHDSTASWHDLACLRALLDAEGATGHEGLVMPLGAGWQEGATNALLRALDRDSLHVHSAELLGLLVLDQTRPKRGEAARDAVARAVLGGAVSPAAARACARFDALAGTPDRSARCAVAALAAGVDSTWMLLHLARLAAGAADTLSTIRFHEAALQAARDDSAWDEVGWHLRWFTEPEEWAEWDTLPPRARPSWIRDRLAARDLRDGRRPGARIVEHFRRLEHAEAHFLRDVSRAQRGRAAVTAVAEDVGPGKKPRDPDAMRFTSVPEVIAAYPYRYFVPWTDRLDDRGTVYLRFGEPTRRMYARATETDNYNVREGWLYALGEQSLVLQFEGEYFDRSGEATRLVAGVLGNYLCDLEATRCALVRKLQCFPPPVGMRCSGDPEYSPVKPEEVARLRQRDEDLIARATTQDDNSLRPDHPVATVAQFARVWDPRSLQPLAVVPYAFRLGDLERIGDTAVTLHLALRQWSAARGEWQEAAFDRNLRIRGRHDDDARVTGYSVVRSAPDASAWALHASQGADRAGRAWADRIPPLETGALRLSDLVLGAASQGETWTTSGGTAVPLGPLGAFDRDEPVAVYWQLRSVSRHDTARVTIALHAVGAGGEARPALAVSFAGPIAAGLSEWQRELGVRQLDRGEYRIEVVVEAGEEAARRTGRLLLR